MLDQTDIAGRMLDDLGLKPAFVDLTISTPESLPLVEAGEYEAICISCRKEKRFNRGLLALKFRLVTEGQYFGMVLDAFVNLDFGQGSTRNAPPRSKLAAWIRLIARFDPAINVARFKASTFSRYLFIVQVESSKKVASSKKGSEQQDGEPCSRVAQLVGVVGRLGGEQR